MTLFDFANKEVRNKIIAEGKDEYKHFDFMREKTRLLTKLF